MNTCQFCRHWKNGRCHGSTPLAAAPDAPSFFPITAATDACAKWAGKAAPARSKATDEMIVAWVKDACVFGGEVSNCCVPRSSAIEWLTQDLGMAVTPALSRVNVVARRGLISMGIEPPAEWPPLSTVTRKEGRIYLWPAPEGTTPVSQDEPVLKAVRSGRSSVRTIAAAVGISVGSAHSAVGRLIEQAKIVRTNRGLEAVPEISVEV